MAAIERYTPLSTAEFAVRPFIIKQEARMMQQMAVWARHDNEHVRRLASEGCRPALPWGQALTSFKKRPVAGTSYFGAAEHGPITVCPQKRGQSFK